MKKITHAIIVAAGLGRRIENKSNGLPKSLIAVGGKSLIQRSMENVRSRGVETIDIVVGHQRRELMTACAGPGVRFVFNPFYQTTNNMVSLWFALRSPQPEPFYYLHSDILYPASLLESAASGVGEIVLVTEEKPCDAEAMKVHARNGFLVETSKHVPSATTYGEWTGIAAFTPNGKDQFVMEAEKLMEEGHWQAYDAQAFTGLASRGVAISIAGFRGVPWTEIDNDADLERAEREVLTTL